ncbi:MAG: outer membrane protein assembly factor BamD [Chthoniobacterales bacterium]|nr:outer membrane protein assembly factor BamD [Chthoniobacterales bacterium]
MSQARVICGILASACILLSSAAVFAQAPATPGTDDPAASSLMQQARDFEEAGNYNRAATIYRDIVKRYSVSTTAPTAQFRLAELIDQAGNPNRAFDAYQTLVENYPQSREFDRAVAAQLAIADDFMQRRRYERAGEMYAAILAAAPFAKFAPAAQFKLGQSYESRREYTQAIAAYQAILDRYPSSDYADDALYQIGFVQLSEAQSRSQDLSAAIDAKNTFEEFLMEYPNSEKAAQARENLARMGGREATDLMSIARFYDRNTNYRAAVIYYAELVRRQTGSEDAKIATDRIEEIRATVGDEELRSGPERPETGERAAMRRRLQNQVETSALSNYAGPPVSKVEPVEELPPPSPQLRTSVRDIQPVGPDAADLPPIEPELPTE